MLTYRRFLSSLKHKLSLLGFDPQGFAGSFRQHSSCNIPAELVKLQGDWASPAYFKYFDPGMATKFSLVRALASNIPTPY